MIRRPPRSTQSRSSAASDVYKRQILKRSIPGTSLLHCEHVWSPLDQTLRRDVRRSIVRNLSLKKLRVGSPDAHQENWDSPRRSPPARRSGVAFPKPTGKDGGLTPSSLPLRTNHIIRPWHDCERDWRDLHSSPSRPHAYFDRHRFMCCLLYTSPSPRD